MSLNVRVTDLIRSGSQISKERERPVRVAILVEPDAPDALIDVVRDRFKPYTSNARLQIEVAEPDLRVGFASDTDFVLGLVGSGAAGIAPSLEEARERAIPAVAIGLAYHHDTVAERARHPYADSVADSEPERAVDVELAAWLVERIASKRIALAHNFPFVRKDVAEESVKATAMQNALIGAVIIIPGADMPLMTLNQGKMLLQIAAAYGEHLGAERVKELAAIVGGGVAFRAVARQLLVVVPGFGWAVKGVVAYGGTLAMGRAAIAYFEHGGDLSEVAHRAVEARDAAVRRLRESQAALKGAAAELKAAKTAAIEESSSGGM